MRTVPLPYEPNYTGHRAELQRRDQTRRWLAERERRLEQHESPSLVPGSENDQSAALRPPARLSH